MKKNEEDKQKEFINSTLQKLKENINNFITKTNYSNIQSLYLLQQIDDYQKINTQLNQQKILQQNSSNDNSSIKKETILPLLLERNNPKIPYKREVVYSSDSIKRKKENDKKPEKYNIIDIFNPSLSIQESLSSEIKY